MQKFQFLDRNVRPLDEKQTEKQTNKQTYRQTYPEPTKDWRPMAFFSLNFTRLNFIRLFDPFGKVFG